MMMDDDLARPRVTKRAALRLACGGTLTALLASTAGVMAPLRSARAADTLDLSRPIRLVVPLTPGGGADALARIVAEELRTVIPGASVIVENRPGALGVIGTSSVAKAAPDGHTLILSVGATFSANPSLVKNLSYDPLKDFTHVVRLATNGYVLVVGPASSATTLQGLIDEGRANPKKLAFGYGTTTTFVASSTFARASKFEALAVSYQAQPPALTDLLGGQTHFMFADVLLLAPYIKSGKIKALGVSSAERVTVLPDVPTMIEQGYKGFDLGTFVGLSAPAGTPPGIVAQLNAAVNKIMLRPDVKAKAEAIGFDVSPISPAQFTDFISEQMVVWTKSIKESGVEPQ